MRAFDCSDVTSMEALVTELDASYLLTDTCVSLAHRKFAKDVDAVVSRARAAGESARVTSVLRVSVQAFSEWSVARLMTTRFATLSDSVVSSRVCRHLSSGVVSLSLSETLFCCSGFAPSEVTKWTEDSARELQSSIESNAECVAVGEIGKAFQIPLNRPFKRPFNSL